MDGQRCSPQQSLQIRATRWRTSMQGWTEAVMGLRDQDSSPVSSSFAEPPSWPSGWAPLVLGCPSLAGYVLVNA